MFVDDTSLELPVRLWCRLVPSHPIVSTSTETVLPLTRRAALAGLT